MRRRNITIPDVLWDRLKKKADTLGISVSDLLRRAAEYYLEKKDAAL